MLELPGRGDVERVAGNLVDLRLERFEALGVPLAQFAEPLNIDADAAIFQLGENLDQRHLHVAKQPIESGFNEPCFQDWPHPEGHNRILARIVRHLPDGHFVHPLLALACADERLDLDRLMTQVSPRQLVEPVVALARGQQVAGDHRVERQTGQPHARGAEHDHVVLEVLADFLHRRVLEHGAERLQHQVRVEARFSRRGADRQVPGLVRLPGEAVADNAGPAGPDVCRLRIQRNGLLPLQFVGKRFECLVGVDEPVDGVSLWRRLGGFAWQGCRSCGQRGS